MNTATTPSPFHRGEQQAQQRLGVREKIERVGQRVISDHLLDQHRNFYQQLPFVFVGHADKQGWPWASILLNQPGFMTSDSDKVLTINSAPIIGDPLADSLQQDTRLGLLGIELETRRRNRLSGHIIESKDQQIQLAVDQSFGNCPKYIQTREFEWLDPTAQAAIEVEEISRFDSQLQRLIEQSDTFFVASAISNNSGDASEGADVSHRGGRPGFIRVDSDTTLTIPDYSGNKHFNTLGNFIENPRAGLLFLDFEKGDLITLTGTVEVLWDSAEAELFAGAERLWQFHIDHGRKIANGLPLKGKLNEFSPHSLATGVWNETGLA